jgi:predicted nucleotidyltransferase
MTLDELIALIARLFSSKGYRYFTFGGVGVSLWGRPRTTHDLDVVVCLERRAVPAFVADLKGIGFKIARSHQRKLMDGRILRLPIGDTGLDVKLCGRGHDMEALARAKRAEFEGFALMVASAEDLVLYKLQVWRTQDQADIENLLSNVKGLDRRYIRRHLAPIEESTGHPLRERWEDIVRRV